MRARLALLLVGGALTLVIPQSAAADRFFANSPVSVSNLTAFQGVLAWGGWPFEGPSAYYVSRGGAVTRLGVHQPTKGNLGQIDLGPGPHGGMIAVYERCPVQGDSGIVCDIYRYSLGSRRGGRVRRAASRRHDEHAPSVWKGRVVFFRPHGGLFETSPFVRLANPFVTGTDLRGHTVAYATRTARGVTKIFVKRIGRRGRGRSCQITRATSGGAVDLVQPHLDADYVYWLRQNYAGASELTIHRRRRPTRSCRSRGPEQLEPRAIPVNPGSFAVARGRLFYGDTTFPAGAPRPHFEIWELQPVHFVNRW